MSLWRGSYELLWHHAMSPLPPFLLFFTLNLTFWIFDLGAFYPNLALKCYSEALLAKYCLMGASVAPLTVKVAPGVKMLLRAWKWAQPCRKRTPDHSFLTFWNFSFKPLKNGLKNEENYFFSESDETLGGPSTFPYDSKKMPNTLIYIDTWTLITS